MDFITKLNHLEDTKKEPEFRGSKAARPQKRGSDSRPHPGYIYKRRLKSKFRSVPKMPGKKEERSECHKCGKMFASFSAKERHYREVHLKQRVQCFVCGHKTARAHDLIGHIKRRHSRATGLVGSTQTPKKKACASKKSCTDTPKTRVEKLKGYLFPKDRPKTKAMLKEMPTIVINKDPLPPLFQFLYQSLKHLISKHQRYRRQSRGYPHARSLARPRAQPGRMSQRKTTPA